MSIKLTRPRIRALKEKYNLTEKDFHHKFNTQGMRCAICRVEFTDRKQHLHVDHDHRTGRVRGLLCSHCNSGLGFFKDNVRFLIKAGYYLRSQPQDPVFKGQDFPDDILLENGLGKLIRK
jgi:hypothetical protein